MVLNTDWAQVEVIDLINDGSGLAFGIIGGRSTGVVVKTIVPGGVADRDGRLQSGDHILQIGEVNLRGLGSEQVASVLRQCGVHVRLVVARPVESTSADYQALGSHAPIVPTKILGDPVELDKHLIDNGYGDIYIQNPSNSYSAPYIYTGQPSDLQLHTISGLVDVVRDPLPIGTVPPLPPLSLPPVTSVNLLPLDMALRDSSLPETELFTLDLMKDDLGLGITVAGYVCEKEEISGIFVKSISKGSAADLAGKIKINDRIIEVNGESVLGQTNHQAVEVLRNAGNKVTIRFERYLRGPKYEQLQQAILANEFRSTSPPSPSASSLPKIPLSLVHMSSLGIEPEGDSRTSFDFDSAVLQDLETPTNDFNEIVIDTADGRKSVQFSICSHQSIYEKWREKLRDDIEIVIAEMNKEAHSGLGISLEGTVDVEDGQEVRPHHYIRNILPNGPVGKNAILESGDELLEVNGIQLLGLNHVEVVSILKQLPSLVILVCARYSVPTRIIDTAQHRDAFQARNILAESISTLMQSTERLVKAKSDSSIASSLASETCCSVGSRSRSLEIVAGLPMWSNEATEVVLNKGDHGLGFSILDYQDPLNPQETVIVIRSLIPGGIAQQDGSLIPGDRLLAVNNINVEHATLDRAVQVLKGAPKGPVKITVAKPLSSNDSVSHQSQDTEDDQTCIDDFQECIEEYQECLEVVQICIEEDRSFNQSPNLSQVEDFGVIHNSEPELSFKSLCETKENHVPVKTEDSEKDGYETCLDESFSDELAKADDKTPTNSTHDLIEEFGNRRYKTEMYVDLKSDSVESEDIEFNKQILEKEIAQINQELQKINRKKESLKKKLKRKIENNTFVEHALVHEPLFKQESSIGHNLKIPLIDEIVKAEEVETQLQLHEFLPEEKHTFTSSEPCLNNTFTYTKHNHICLDSNPDGLKSYDNTKNSIREDEFFLVQYPEELAEKSYSEPNVLERCNPGTTYRYRIAEYYNDIEDCLQSFRETQSFMKAKQPEMCDESIFNEIVLPIKSRSAPDILDNSFITLTYDPGPDMARRKSFNPGHNIQSDNVPMTVNKKPENSSTIKSIDVSNMLEKHWGPTRTVRIVRDPNRSLGISIVGGKVDLYHESSPETILGIFIKNVVPDSPAGLSGELKTGDRILEVSGISLKNLSHADAVETIKYARSPVTFVVQSLTPYTPNTDSHNSNEINCSSPYPSPAKGSPPSGYSETKTKVLIDFPPKIHTPPQRKSFDQNYEQKLETKSSIKSEAKFQQKSQSKSEQKPEASKLEQKSEIFQQKSEIKPEVKPGQLSELKSGQKSEIKSGQKSEIKSGQKSEIKSGQKSEIKSGEISEIKAGQKSEIKSGQKSEIKSGQKSEIKSGQKSEIKSALKSEIKSGQITEIKPGVKSGQVPEVKPGQGKLEQKPEELPKAVEAKADQQKQLPVHKSVEFKEQVIVNSIEPIKREKTVESSEESEEEEDVRDLGGRTVTSKGQEIDRASAGNTKRTKEESALDPEEEDDFGYTMNKVKKKYSNLGHNILMVQLERSAGQGLGLSLAGHKDRSCMAVFVCGINPNGAAFRTGGIQVGDEILEVNGVVLHGRCHLNASAIIKGLSGPIFKVIILRRKAAIDDIAVRPLTQFPVSLAEEASEETYSNYPNVRTISIKKGSQSLGIMIIEGKHAEVGQGIFISDIQEGSSAEKAGLEIGEMILAVNKDSLLGSNYDTAANLLKRTEGLVRLVVSNPGKRTTTPLPDDKLTTNKGLKAGGASSRPTTPTPEPAADPAVCPLIPGRETTIEICSENKVLGLYFVGGKDTLIPEGIVIVEVYKGGGADKDGRLQPGDQILDVNGITLKDVSYNTASQALRQTLPKMKLIVYRTEKPEVQVLDIEFIKKPGKGLGLSIGAKSKTSGVYVTEVLNGGPADVDGRIMKGDTLVSVNSNSIESSSCEEASAILKTVTGKVSVKLHRFKAASR